MTVQRSRDPTGIGGDFVKVDLRNGVTQKDLDAILEILRAGSPAARIARIRKHETLQAEADRLAARLVGGKADINLLHDLELVELKAWKLEAWPMIVRSKRPGAKKNGFKRDLAGWIATQLTRTPSDTIEELYGRLPDDYQDKDKGGIKLRTFKRWVAAVRKEKMKRDGDLDAAKIDEWFAPVDLEVRRQGRSKGR